MKILKKKIKEIFDLIKFQQYDSDKQYVFTYMCYKVDIEDGILIYNTLTGELLQTTEEELKNEENKLFLVRNWYLVDKDINLYSMCKGIKQVYRNIKRKTYISTIRHATIMTTLQCNARCPYCYEIGRKQSIMSAETAKDIGNYFNKYGKQPLKIMWFGGEPLYNKEAIDIICEELGNKNITFTSKIVSNGYLFDTIPADKLLNEWHTTEVQITLDGTKDTYNNTKRYIYNDTNAFDKVLNNIDYLLSNKIRAVIRLNLSKDNIQDMYELIDLLYIKFKKYVGTRLLTVYSHPLFSEVNLVDEYINIDRYLRSKRMLSNNSLSSVAMIDNCMANNYNSIVINPEGKIGLCEHFSETEFIGDIYGNKLDYDVINEWQLPLTIEECKICPLYMWCTKIKKCPIGNCNEQWVRYQEEKIKDKMLEVYNNAKQES